jgi:hypothetical protein
MDIFTIGPINKALENLGFFDSSAGIKVNSAN